ncbi:MAG: hypothetical protein N2Z23_06365 [Pyrinomonadaceae bacterium]|nr:hypothetical protein [Pyrinomonadaceae bacterium]MCX7640045.1 hypothetical protein [Pyrinomonadaceae bacterium]MDW8304217.1 hypothetical protein [Acidobacteriota bacterium]
MKKPTRNLNQTLPLEIQRMIEYPQHIYLVFYLVICLLSRYRDKQGNF